MRKYRFGKTSRSKLFTSDFKLRELFQEALDLGLIDISILTGTRHKDEQNELCRKGLSKLKYPNSRHNCKKGDFSKAIDAAPYVNGKVSYDHKHCCFLAGIVLAIAKSKGVKIRWGGNWDMDGEPITDQNFQDLIHYELIEE